MVFLNSSLYFVGLFLLDMCVFPFCFFLSLILTHLSTFLGYIHTPEFKKLVIETMLAEKLSYRETAKRFDVSCDKRIKDWERIYLTEGAEGFTLERRGRGSKGRPRQLPKEVEEDLLAEVQRLRAENEYLKNLQALVLERERRQGKKPR